MSAIRSPRVPRRRLDLCIVTEDDPQKGGGMKVIIVGGVAGGASCAARLRRLDEDAEILMVERGPYVSYANCGLPYYIGGVIEKKSNLLVATADTFRDISHAAIASYPPRSYHAQSALASASGICGAYVQMTNHRRSSGGRAMASLKFENATTRTRLSAS